MPLLEALTAGRGRRLRNSGLAYAAILAYSSKTCTKIHPTPNLDASVRMCNGSLNCGKAKTGVDFNLVLSC